MSGFKVVKHFSLDFLGDEWKAAYINFKPLSISDVKNKLPEIAKIQADPEHAVEGMDTLVTLLKDKFIDGKAIADTGDTVDLTIDNIVDLPVEVIGRAFNFLSQGDQANSTLPSVKS